MQQDYLVGFTINLYNLRAPTMGNGLSVSSEGTHRNSIWFGLIQHRGLTLARRTCWFGFWFWFYTIYFKQKSGLVRFNIGLTAVRAHCTAHSLTKDKGGHCQADYE